MEVQPRKPSSKGPAEWFTGDVWIDAVAQGEEPSRVRVSVVHFTPGARTAWHSHALGQTLYVTEGEGRDFEAAIAESGRKCALAIEGKLANHLVAQGKPDHRPLALTAQKAHASVTGMAPKIS